MRQQVGGVSHRSGQHLVQVAHGGEQAPRVGESPAPPGVLGKGECHATRFPLVALPWPEEGTDGLVGSCGSGWTVTTQRLSACSSQEQVAVRESVVAGITQAEWSPVSQRYSSRPPGSLTSAGSRSERSTRFPWTTSRSRSSLSIRIPIAVLAGVMEEVLSLLIINIVARRRSPFGMFPLWGRGRSAVCLLVGFKKYEALLRTEVQCLPTFNRLVVSARHHDPPELLTTDDRADLN